MNCLLNVLGYMIFVPLTFVYDHLAKGDEESTSEDSPA